MSILGIKKNISIQISQIRSSIKEKKDFLTSCLKGQLRDKTLIRYIIWLVLLGVLPYEKGDSVDKLIDKWSVVMKEKRDEYDELSKKHYSVNPKEEDEKLDLSVNNPLSDSKDNIWTSYFADEEIRKTILKDVDRIFPEYPFFNDAKVQEIMMKVLFVWSKENANYGYKQGFHDILAMTIFVLFKGYNTKDDIEDKEDKENREYLKLLNIIYDKKYSENDCYILFNVILNKVKKFYGEKETDDSNWDNRQRNIRMRSNKMEDSAIFKVCDRVQNKVLKAIDPILYEHLSISENIQPQVYMLKWIRLLFLRHFHILDVVILWDNMISFNYSENKINDDFDNILVHICANMICYVRNYLLKNYHVKILERLMNKYPPVEDVYSLFERATKTFKNPKKHFYSKKKKKEENLIKNVSKEGSKFKFHEINHDGGLYRGLNNWQT